MVKKSTRLTKLYHLVTPFSQNYVYLTTPYMHVTKNKIYNKIQFKTNLNKINKIKNKKQFSCHSKLRTVQVQVRYPIKRGFLFFFVQHRFRCEAGGYWVWCDQREATPRRWLFHRMTSYTDGTSHWWRSGWKKKSISSFIKL